MKKIIGSTSILLLAFSSLTCAIGSGFLTQKKRDWTFIQSVGGISISTRDQNLLVNCDVSGLHKVTIEPTLINSGLGVRKVIHQRKGDQIQLTLVTSLIGKGIKTTPKPLDLSEYPEGSYQVVYRDPDGQEHELGTVKLTSAKETPEEKPKK